MKTRSGHAGRAVAAAGVLALLGALVAAVPASAADSRDVQADGTLDWGFRQSFRNYVGQQTAALPPVGPVAVGQRITLVAPATFDAAGTPAWAASTSTPNETLPYHLPVQGGTFESAGDLRIETGGGAVYHFPSHAFTVTVKDVAVVVTGGTATLEGDLSVVIPESGAALGYTPGTYGGDDIVLGDVATVDVDTDGDDVTVTGSGVTLTAAGAAALQDFLAAGSALDSFSVTTSLEADAAVWKPSITVSRTTGFDPSGTESVTVTGTGFDPAANVSSRPPVAVGQSTGVYVTFGRFADVWKPSAGAPSSARSVTSQKWALPQASLTQVSTDYPSQAAALVELEADGSFTATLDVKSATAATGNYGIYVYAAGGAAANASQELFVPISFLGDINVGVEVPETPVEPEPGAFSWTIGGSGAVSLGTASSTAAGFSASGQLPAISVQDTRAGAPAFSISGQVGTFSTADGSHSFGGQALGWTPSVTANTVGAVAGGAVVPGTAATSGLKASSTLVSGAAGHALGSVDVGAQLRLLAPADAAPGSYTATLTLTALS
ncbi:HtaA domain-containing protein [Cellulomonas sp. PhB150]|uniref:HtaA domain-containing protein n=1 Tax=Cellulomonas sp. PhB150 TaxID=2485188 RepID=UPI000FBF4349|nr:HtaA domain-containing protein [Cellulomonas sp. PhB150]ROS23155.1 Htaa protein [Cellulomonas sp. PhB150]